MDNIQNEVDDFVESPNEKVTRRAEAATQKIIGGRYPNGYTQEIYDKIMQEQIKIARQEILDEMKFEQEYKQQRHIGDIEAEQRHLDMYKANLEDEKLFQQGEISDKIYRAEGEIVQDEIKSDFNVRPNC